MPLWAKVQGQLFPSPAMGKLCKKESGVRWEEWKWEGWKLGFGNVESEVSSGYAEELDCGKESGF